MAKRNKHKLAILLPRDTLTDSQLEKLRGIVKDRQDEIKSEFGAKSTEIYIVEDKISFPWFDISPEESQMMEYIYYVKNLCIEAKQ